MLQRIPTPPFFFFQSDMALKIHTDASYLSKSNAHICVGDLHHLGNKVSSSNHHLYNVHYALYLPSLNMLFSLRQKPKLEVATSTVTKHFQYELPSKNSAINKLQQASSQIDPLLQTSWTKIANNNVPNLSTWVSTGCKTASNKINCVYLVHQLILTSQTTHRNTMHQSITRKCAICL